MACVLLFDLGYPAFPVDTHIHRFSKRIGWAHDRCKPEEIEGMLEQVVPEERYLRHINIIPTEEISVSQGSPDAINVL